jgi:hypothetical protein
MLQGLPFMKLQGVWSGLIDDLVWHFSCGLHLLNSGFRLLHLWSFLACPVEF